MPELPEVETLCRAIAPKITNQQIKNVIIRKYQLRYPIPKNIAQQLKENIIHKVSRRGKYLLFHFSHGTLIIHLGMSGFILCYENNSPSPLKHDHVDLVFFNGLCLRYNDARRFGSMLWTNEDPFDHSLLANLGVEPLTADFSADYLKNCSKNRRCSIKQFIMDGTIVVGVGNIYANEALFLAKIHPAIAANELTLSKFQHLTDSIKNVLSDAIKQGGTTIKDFQSLTGKPGYFSQQLRVYGRAGEKCCECKTLIKEIRQGQRSTFYCETCQH